MQPDDSIGYWLSYAQRCFSSAFSEILRRHCVEQGKAYVITPAQWGILSFIAHQQEQTIGALAKPLGVDAPAVTNIVQRLEQSGLVERVRDREDQRVVKVSLSGEGREMMHSLQPVVAAFNEQLLLGEERQEFLEHLRRFIARVSPLVPESAERFGNLRAHEEELRERGKR
jgi:DNA-binding MarR family transcriptional regulator